MSDVKDDIQPMIISAKTGRPINSSRRKFLAHSGMYGAGLVGSALLGACSNDDNVSLAANGSGNNPDAIVIDGPSDQAVLNFALNLEYLEAEYYLRAVTGNGLDNGDRGSNPGAVTGGSQVTFSTPLIRAYANEIAGDERQHVRFLRSALGSGAASAPAINVGTAFEALANAAGYENFNPYSTELQFLIGAFVFEDVGVTAYKGASPFVRNRTFLEAAAGLLAVEAYHAGLVRTVLTSMMDQPVVGVMDSDDGTTPNVRTFIQAISDTRDAVDGSSDLDQGIAYRDSDVSDDDDDDQSNIVPTDGNALAYSRSPGQVLNIVYLTPAEAMQGGFFPNGVNGTLNTSANNSGNTGNAGDSMDDGDMAGNDMNDEDTDMDDNTMTAG